MLDSIMQALGVKSMSGLLGGAVGALMSLKFAGNLTTSGSIVMFLSGLAVSIFLTPLAMHIFSIGEMFIGGVAFLLGMLGMAIMASTMTVLPDVLRSRLSK